MIYLDQDGVLADFDLALLRRGIVNKNTFLHRPKSEWTDEDKELDRKVVSCMQEDGWFATLPVIPGALLLVQAALDVGEGVSLLTARPNNNNRADQVAQEKKSWLKNNIPQHYRLGFVCCLRSEKALYAVDDTADILVSNILIDDLPANVDEWQKADGIGILFKNSTQAIKDLKKIV